MSKPNDVAYHACAKVIAPENMPMAIKMSCYGCGCDIYASLKTIQRTEHFAGDIRKVCNDCCIKLVEAEGPTELKIYISPKQAMDFGKYQAGDYEEN